MTDKEKAFVECVERLGLPKNLGTYADLEPLYQAGYAAALSASSGTPEDEEQAFLAAWKEHANSEYVGDEQIAYGHAWAKAKEHFSASSGWVAVSERLPERDDSYLVTTQYTYEPGKHKPCFGVDSFADGKFSDPYVIAWQEKPAPFTVEETKV